jgi:hypothetical protein
MYETTIPNFLADVVVSDGEPFGFRTDSGVR